MERLKRIARAFWHGVVRDPLFWFQSSGIWLLASIVVAVLGHNFVGLLLVATSMLWLSMAISEANLRRAMRERERQMREALVVAIAETGEPS